MSNITTVLEKLQRIDGFIGAALVDSDSGMTLGVLGGGGQLNLEVAAAGNTEVVRAKRKAMGSLNLRDEIEDILITLGKHYHLIRPLRSRQGVFFYLALDRARANLALARLTLADVEKELQLLPGSRELPPRLDCRADRTMRVGNCEAELDHYQTLRVSPSATPADIRRAHRRLVQRYHPDHVRGEAQVEAERQMKAINHAASLLLDPVARATYDRLRGVARPPAPRPAPVARPAWYDAPPTPPAVSEAIPTPSWRDRAASVLDQLTPVHGSRGLPTLVGGALLASLMLALAAPLLGGPVPVSSSDYRIPRGPQRETMWASLGRLTRPPAPTRGVGVPR